MEKDDEVHNVGGTVYDYGFRIYDARLGRFLSVDPLASAYPWYTPYQFAGNKPIVAIDIDGLEEYVIHYIYNKRGKLTKIRIYRIEGETGALIDNQVRGKDGEIITTKKVLVLHLNKDGTQYKPSTDQDQLSKAQAKILNTITTHGTHIGVGSERSIKNGIRVSKGWLLRTESKVSTVPVISFSPKGVLPFISSSTDDKVGSGPVTGKSTLLFDLAFEEASKQEILLTGSPEFVSNLTKRLIGKGIDKSNILTSQDLSDTDKQKFSENSSNDGLYFIKKTVEETIVIE